MVQITKTKPINMNAKLLKMHLKVRDEMSFRLYDDEAEEILEYEGYVPHVLIPGEYGDYMELHIDIDTGMIVNWKVPSSKDLSEFIESNS